MIDHTIDRPEQLSVWNDISHSEMRLLTRNNNPVVQFSFRNEIVIAQ